MCSGSITILLQFTIIFATSLQPAGTNHAGMAKRVKLNVKLESKGPEEGLEEGPEGASEGGSDRAEGA